MSYDTLTPLTQDEIQRIGAKAPEPGYPPVSNRLIIPRVIWNLMAQRGEIDLPDLPAYHIVDHPNRRGVLEVIDPIATAERPMSSDRVAHWRELGLLVDSAGRPLHPRAPELLPVVGMYTGPGWSYRYGPQRVGNLALRRVRNGSVQYAVVAVQRGTVMWGLPGGYSELGETPREAALREANEEAGVDLRSEALRQRIGQMTLHDTLARLKCSPKDTLHAWLEEWFTFAESRENPTLEGVEIGASNPEVLEARWMHVVEIMLHTDFLGTHKRAIKAREDRELYR